ncbi:MAG: hypothetical protein Q9M40_05750 [Sulfurimonas sp.]|nr:hypothetical protein [Sulfurimonas sp.]
MVVNVSPISTMVHSFIKDANKTQEEAESAVRTMLELPTDADLSLDPVAEAKTDATLLKAALKLQKTIEVLAKAKESAGVTASTKEIAEELYKNLALQSNVDTLTTVVQSVVTADTDLDDNVTDSTDAIIGHIDTIIGNDVNETAVIGTKISAIQSEIEDAIQNNTTPPTDAELSVIIDSDFSLLHAQEILRMLEISDVNATDVQAVLQSAGMTEYEFLSLEDEIKALQGDTRTKSVGDKLYYYMNEGFEQIQGELETEAIEEAVAGGDLSATLPFTFPYAWYNIWRDSDVNGLGEGLGIVSTSFGSHYIRAN